jgi:predicted Fe-Mo cluster-binding NifX family protein
VKGSVAGLRWTNKSKTHEAMGISLPRINTQFIERNTIMKIAVSSEGQTLEAAIDPRFGRCAYYLVVETDSMSFEALENPNMELGGGAGIQSARLISQEGVTFLLTGNCGPNAYETLEAAGIGVITGCSGIVKDAVENFKKGDFTSDHQSNVESHYGVDKGKAGNPLGMDSPPKRSNITSKRSGMVMGRGRGMGGMGMGSGMGRGRGMGGGGKGMRGGRGMGGGGKGMSGGGKGMGGGGRGRGGRM